MHTFLRSLGSAMVDDSADTSTRKRRKLSREDEHITSVPARVIRQIPRVQRDLPLVVGRRDDEEDLKVDWYALYKISHNWQRGSFSTRYLQTHVDPSSIDFPASTDESSQLKPYTPTLRNLRTLVDSTASLIFAAFNPSASTDNAPAILVFSSDSKKAIREEGNQKSIASYTITSTQRKGRSFITSLAVDRSNSANGSILLFVGCSDGSSSVIAFDEKKNKFYSQIPIQETCAYPIVAAVLTSPLLVTCTASFHLRLYKVDKSDSTLLEERRTYSCHWPASLRLEAISDASTSSFSSRKSYRFSIAYSTPVYPLGWTVGLQEIIIQKDLLTSSRSASARKAYVVTQIDSPSRDDRKKVSAIDRPTLEERRQQVGRLTSLSYEDPYIVVGTKDNEVVCFKVVGAASNEKPDTDLCLSHVCNFQGHTGTVHSVSLNEGRCVTGGSDGSVRVWRLGDEEASLAKATGLLATFDARLRRGLGKVISISSSLQSTGKRKRDDEGQQAKALSLADILRDTRSGVHVESKSSSSSAIVRLVTSAFDQIISVSSVRSNDLLNQNRKMQSGQCRREAIEEEEQVQIWSFA